MIEPTGSSGTVHLSDEAIDAVIAALPPDYCPRRLALLPRIIREWVHVDLPRHSDYYSRERRATARERNRQLKVLGQCAQNLIEALAALDKDGLREVAVWTESQRTHKPLLGLDQSDRAEGLNRQRLGVDWLADLSLKFRDWENPNVKGRGRPKELIPYLVMLDLQAIFEYATGIKAERKVHNPDHPDYGHEYGEFWNFLQVIWPIVFGSMNGLSYALQNWSAAKRKFGEASAIVANISFRHREWGIFDE